MRFQKNRLLLHILQIIMLLFIILPGLAFHKRIHDFSTKMAENIKSNLVGALEKEYAIRLEYDSISPSFLHFMAVRNLKIYTQFGQKPVLVIKKLKFRHSLMGLLFGNKAIINRIYASGLWVDIQPERDALFHEHLKNRSKGASSSLPLDISRIFRGSMKLRDWHLLYGQGAQTFRAEGSLITVKTLETFMRLNLRGAFSYRSQPAQTLNSLELEARIQGTIQNDLSSFSFNSDFYNIKNNLAHVEDLRLNLSYGDEQFKVKKIKDNKAWGFTLSYQEEVIRLKLKAMGFKPSSMLSFKSSASLADFNPWLDTLLTGDGNFEFHTQNQEIRYGFKGQARMYWEELPFPLSWTLDVEGDNRQLFSRDLGLLTGYGGLNWQGLWIYDKGFPEGKLILEDLKAGEEEKISGLVKLKSLDEYFSIKSDFLTLSSGQSPGRFNALLHKNQESLVFSLLAELASGKPGGNQILVDGEMTPGESVTFRTFFQFRDLELNSLKPYLPASVRSQISGDWGKYLLNSKGAVSFSHGQPLIQLTDLDLSMPGEDKNLYLSGFIGHGSIDVDSFKMNWNENRIQGTGHSSLSQGKRQFASTVNVNGRIYDFKGDSIKDKVRVEGSHGLRLGAVWGKGAPFLASVSFKEFPLTWNGQDYFGSVNLQGRYEKQNWEFYLVESLFTWPGSSFFHAPELRLSAYFSPGALNIYNIKLKDSLGELEGEGSFFYNLAEEVYNGTLQLQDTQDEKAQEFYDFYGAFTQGSLSANLQVQQGRLARFPLLGLKGRWDASINFDGSLEDPKLTAKVSAPDLTRNQKPFALEGRVNMTTRCAELYDLKIRDNNLYLDRGLGVFNFKDGSLVFSAALNSRQTKEHNGMDMDIETGLSVEANTGITIDFNSFKAKRSDSFKGRMRLNPVKWNGLTTFPSKTLVFEGKKHIFEAWLQNDKEQRVYYDSTNGDFYALLKEEFPLAFKARGYLKPEKLDVKFRNLVINLHTLNYIMPRDYALDSQYVVFREGSVLAGRAAMTGTLKDPVFSASLESRNLNVLTPYTKAEIGQAHIKAEMKNNQLKTNDVFIPVGTDGSGLKARGTMALRGWAIGEYNLDIEVVGKPGVPVSYNAYGIQAMGAVIGKFRYYGDGWDGNLDGEVYVNDLIGSLGEETPLPEGPFPVSKYTFKLNLDILTGKNVLFVLPDPRVEIIRASAEPGERLNIFVDTVNQSFSITGAVNLKDGSISYLDQNFRLSKGSLIFNENEEIFNPFLNIEAQVDTVEPGGRAVTIYLMFRNPVLDEFIPHFRSVPYMPESQIISLFGQSIVPQNKDGGADISRLLAATGSMVGQYGFISPLEEFLKRTLKLDKVTIKTKLLENAILEQIKQGNRNENSASSNPVAKYLDDTSIYFGKFLGESLYFSIGAVVDYDQLYGLRSFSNGIKVVPDLSIEMKTPFFLVYWNYSRKNANDLYNTNFIKNNGIGLKWQYSW